MLEALTEEGHLLWTCHGCQTRHTVHHSHEAVQVHHVTGRPLHHRVVGLPPCECGTRAFLKVDFTPQELAAPNMVDQQGRPTASHAAALRHMALVPLLEASGKPVQDTVETQPVLTGELTERDHALIVGFLQEAGVRVSSLKELATRIQAAS
jgi:hypothetical protein